MSDLFALLFPLSILCLACILWGLACAAEIYDFIFAALPAATSLRARARQ
jgi:hypothetical protein